MEDILNQKSNGIAFSVINKGIIETDTRNLLSRLDDNLDICKPDMVIAMMGVNDPGRRLVYRKTGENRFLRLLSELKAVKLVKLLWLRARDTFQEEQKPVSNEQENISFFGEREPAPPSSSREKNKRRIPQGVKK